MELIKMQRHVSASEVNSNWSTPFLLKHSCSLVNNVHIKFIGTSDSLIIQLVYAWLWGRNFSLCFPFCWFLNLCPLKLKQQAPFHILPMKWYNVVAIDIIKVVTPCFFPIDLYSFWTTICESIPSNGTSDIICLFWLLLEVWRWNNCQKGMFIPLQKKL